MVNILVPPNILKELTGVKYIRIKPNSATLVYTDNSEESAKMKTDGMEFLNIVSAIQSKRGA